MVASFIPPVLRGVASLVPVLGGAAYTASQKPEGIEEVFKSVVGTGNVSKFSDSLTKETNVKKVADRLKAAGVDPAAAEKLAQGAIGKFGDAVIGDDEASTIAQDIGRGLEGGKPSGSAMIDFGGEEERGKILRDPLITKPSEVGTDIKEGFSETEGIAQLPPFMDQGQEKVNVGDVGFTEAPSMPSIYTMALGDDYEKVGVIINNDPNKRKLLESIDSGDSRGAFVSFQDPKNPEDITGRVFQELTFGVTPDKMNTTIGTATNELPSEYGQEIEEAKGKNVLKANRLNGGQFDLIEAPEEYEKYIGKGILNKKNGILSSTTGSKTTLADHLYSTEVVFNNNTKLKEFEERTQSPILMPTTTGERTPHNVIGFIQMKSSGKAIHPLYDTITHGKPVEIQRLNTEYDELYDPIRNLLKENDVIYSGGDAKDKKLQETALDVLTNQIINTNIVNSNTLNTFLRKPDYLLSDAAREYVDYINEKINPNIIKTNSGVKLDFGNQKDINRELGAGVKKYFNEISFNYDGDKSIFDVFGNPAPIEGQDVDPRFLVGYKTESGAKGYAYGFLTDKDIAFVDYLSTTQGSLSPTEYKEIKDALKEYTGASKVAGIRISGSRKGLSEETQTTIMKAAGGIVDKPLYDR